MTPDELARMDAEDDEARARLDAPDALARAARWYASNGVAVFPLRYRGKAPLLAKAHPDEPDVQDACKRSCGRDGHGLYDATTDVDRVEAWWKATPQANIGIRTGVGLDVVDVDGPPGVWTFVNHLLHGACPRLPDSDRPACCEHGHDCHGDGVTLDAVFGPVLGRAQTGGEHGGFHLYVASNGSGCTPNLLPGIDYKGEGGYVVAAPSVVLRRYVWQEPLTPPQAARAVA